MWPEKRAYMKRMRLITTTYYSDCPSSRRVKEWPENFLKKIKQQLAPYLP
jgi:hypothetical protein